MTLDEKGRVLIPARVRRKLGLRGKIKAEQKGSRLVLSRKEEEDFFTKYAGFLGEQNSLTAEALDALVEKTAEKEAAKKFR